MGSVEKVLVKHKFLGLLSHAICMPGPESHGDHEELPAFVTFQNSGRSNQGSEITPGPHGHSIAINVAEKRWRPHSVHAHAIKLYFATQYESIQKELINGEWWELRRAEKTMKGSRNRRNASVGWDDDVRFRYYNANGVMMRMKIRLSLRN